MHRKVCLSFEFIVFHRKMKDFVLLFSNFAVCCNKYGVKIRFLKSQYYYSTAKNLLSVSFCTHSCSFSLLLLAVLSYTYSFTDTGLPTQNGTIYYMGFCLRILMAYLMIWQKKRHVYSCRV